MTRRATSARQRSACGHWTLPTFLLSCGIKKGQRAGSIAGRQPMFVTKALARLTMCAGLMVLASLTPTTVHAQQTVKVGATDIGGTVVGAAGPEAGVWVIAETTDLPTRFARIVVTDDQGRYLIPDLPAANSSVSVRGYGLV